MQRLEIRESELMKLAVQDEIARSDESRYDHRLHIILLICEGWSAYEVADLYGHSPRTIQSLIKRFEEGGFDALHDRKRPGRMSRLSGEQMKEIARDLRRSPRELGYSQNLWDGKLLSRHVSVSFGVNLGVRQCQRMFRSLGFRRRKPRPVLAKSDPEAQEAYKKTRSDGGD